MATARLVVLEVNEVPLRVLEHMADGGTCPQLARLLSSSTVAITEVRERLPREMYPSQTWASMGMGVPWSEHQVFWFNDRKPVEHPFYWQQAARRGRTVGLVGTLHSSPLDRQCPEPEFLFVLPDCFAEDTRARPAQLERFQQLNLRLTQRSGRTSSVSPALGDLRDLSALRHLGLRLSTVRQLTRLVAGVASGRVPRERLRLAQFLLLRDLFLRKLSTDEPDLGVFFTNHVASAMHRYWYATFPGDFERPLYDQAWIERYHREIPAAVERLDEFIGSVRRFCQESGRTLVLTSSMGQAASTSLSTDRSLSAVVTDPHRFLTAIGVRRFRVAPAMVPQLSMLFETEADAESALRRLQVVAVEGLSRVVDRSDRTITVSYDFARPTDTLVIDGVAIPAAAAGVSLKRVDDHGSGRHHPDGVLIIDGPVLHSVPARLDYLGVSSILLELLGLDEPAAVVGPRVQA